MKKKMKILSLALLLIVSLIVILYPLIANYLSEKNRSLIETQYTEAIEQMDTTALDEARAAASAYNETLLTVPDKPFTKDALIKASESYDALLNVRMSAPARQVVASFSADMLNGRVIVFQ